MQEMVIQAAEAEEAMKRKSDVLGWGRQCDNVPAQAVSSQCQWIQERAKAVGEAQEQEASDNVTEAEAEAEAEAERRRRRRRQQWDALHDNKPGGDVLHDNEPGWNAVAVTRRWRGGITRQGAAVVATAEATEQTDKGEDKRTQ
jgi:hypothetical protein